MQGSSLPRVTITVRVYRVLRVRCPGNQPLAIGVAQLRPLVDVGGVDVVLQPVPLHQLLVRVLPAAPARPDLGFGRMVVSEIEAPNMLVDLV